MNRAQHDIVSQTSWAYTSLLQQITDLEADIARLEAGISPLKQVTLSEEGNARLREVLQKELAKLEARKDGLYEEMVVRLNKLKLTD